MARTREAAALKLKSIWLWLVDMWEFLVLLTIGFHPARNIFSLQRESEESHELISTCLNVYRRSEVNSLSQLKDLLSSCTPLGIARHTTDSGYNLLQLAVQKGDLQFLEYLLIEKKINPNISKCSLPLHIALDMGSVEMVRMLLEYKARTRQRVGMCYPQPHVPVYDSHSKFFFVSSSMVCGGLAKDAYERAIDKDSVELLQLLLEKKNSSRQSVLLLHYACDVGAIECIKHLVETWHADVNATDSRGCNAVIHSLKSSLNILHYLVSKGADVTCTTYQGRTTLHMLFCNPNEDVPFLVEKTRLFLALGVDNLVNQYDVFRNTALHYLCSKHSLNGSSSTLECLGLLLTHNADTFLCDADEKLPILTLLQCSCLNSVNLEGSNEWLPHSQHQNGGKAGAEQVDHIVKLFAQSNIKSVQGAINRENETVMFYLLRMAFDTKELSYLNTLRVLQDYGANINHVAVTQMSGISKPTKFTDVSARSLLSVCGEQARLELQSVADDLSGSERSFLSQVLEALFHAGLDPNAQQIECRTLDHAQNVKALACFTALMQNCQSYSQLALIEQWIRTSLQWGGNPEVQFYRPEPQICTSQGSIFLKQTTSLPIMQCFSETTSRLWSSHPASMKRIVLLLASTMSQSSVSTALAAMSATLISSLQPTCAVNLHALLDSIVTQPRSLQALASRQIYTSMGRGVSKDRVRLLPLPTSLKDTVSLLR
ncbi:ankyrin-2-like isoform X2 [Watersipora subatra]